MKYILLVVLIIIFIRIMFGSLSLKIEADNNHLKISIKVFAWYINIFKYERYKQNKKQKKKRKKRDFNKIVLLKIYKYYIQKFRKIKIDCIKLDANIGIDDAANTALLAGTFKAFLYAIIPIIFPKIKIAPDINIQPNFNEKIFKFNFFCILRIKITHIINAIRKFNYIMDKGKVIKDDGR